MPTKVDIVNKKLSKLIKRLERVELTVDPSIYYPDTPHTRKSFDNLIPINFGYQRCEVTYMVSAKDLVKPKGVNRAFNTAVGKYVIYLHSRWAEGKQLSEKLKSQILDLQKAKTELAHMEDKNEPVDTH